ncbi:hypothetical protein [Chromobacterium rhizoryzae]|uniref:hypothetical protein n=1 Tax=Chromobacterium rhizoryzae TaxID=1778675 RepID=UPI001D091A1A|nr:hypothetical protein [Chromobacterium rhizoryzae]
MKLYENIVIGNFLFGLGFSIRAKRNEGTVGCAINLLQQTPADHLLGDLMVEFPGVLRLIEFKTAENHSNKEKRRHQMLSVAVQGTPMESVSRSIHWYIETAAEKKSLIARIIPYLDAFNDNAYEHRLESFIESIADEVMNPPAHLSKEDIAEYLAWVRRTNGNGTVGTGCLLLVAQADGTLHYAPMEDLIELRLQHRNWIDLHMGRTERDLKHQLSHAKLRQKEIERDGPSFGH